jgi:hypothetical protein
MHSVPENSQIVLIFLKLYSNPVDNIQPIDLRKGAG